MFSIAILVLSLAPLLARSAPAQSHPFNLFHLAGPIYKRDWTTSPSAVIKSTLATMGTPSATTNGGSGQPMPSSATSDAVLVLPADPQLTFQTPFKTEENPQDPDRPLMMGYYPDWAGPSFPPEKIDFNRFDWIDFAFAFPDEGFSLIWDSAEAQTLLHRLVTAAHSNNKKVKLSVGGWTGSRNFSPAVASSQSRTIFVNNIRSTYDEYDLDGIDIDWEYPGQQGNKGNQVDSRDTANFLLFLQLLRDTLPPSARITCATLTSTWVDENGQPMGNLSQFAKILDWVLLMNYDVWGSSSTPGSNAPLNDGCEDSTQPNANAVAGYDNWSSAGFRPSQIVLGMPSYGYISSSNATNLRTRSQPRSAVPGLRRPSNGDVDKRDQTQTLGVSGEDGGDTVQFRELEQQGAIARTEPANENNISSFDGAGGFERHWDSCSSTPFLCSQSAHQVITYDDPESLCMKAKFAKSVGMLGTNMFDIHGDTDEWVLADALRRGLGLI